VSPRQRQAELILRNHNWSDAMVASITGLTEDEVAEVRKTLEAPCPGRR
jgi:hypothetical protein